MRPEVEYAEPDYTVHVLNTPNDRGGGGGGGGSTSFNLTVQATADGVTKNIGIVKVTVP
jgi:ribulose 1,5-bisphosphate synthetase/thiazole synthase